MVSATITARPDRFSAYATYPADTPEEYMPCNRAEILLHRKQLLLRMRDRARRTITAVECSIASMTTLDKSGISSEVESIKMILAIATHRHEISDRAREVVRG